MRAIFGCLVTAAFLTAACSESAGPRDEFVWTMENVAGYYIATTFTREEGGVTTDQISPGASIEVLLVATGITSGRLFVPGGGEDGSDFDANLVGTWQLSRDSVTLSHDADTFLRDMTLAVGDTHLTGVETFGGVTIRVVLAR